MPSRVTTIPRGESNDASQPPMDSRSVLPFCAEAALKLVTHGAVVSDVVHGILCTGPRTLPSSENDKSPDSRFRLTPAEKVFFPVAALTVVTNVDHE